MAAWGAYVMIQTNQNANALSNIQTQLSARKEERLWAKELYTQFDSTVSRSADDGARADRLAGLPALTELTDQPRLKSEMRRLIREQGAKYEASLEVRSVAGGQILA